MKIGPYILAILAVFSLLSCEKNPLDIDVSEIQIDMPIHRMDEILFSNQLSNTNIQVLYQKYPSFFSYYTEGILRIGPKEDSLSAENLLSFINDPFMSQAAGEMARVLDDTRFNQISEDLESSFKHYHYYYPGDPIPEIYLYHSGFNYGVFPTDSLLLIGLDFYLGPRSDITLNLHPEIFPSYRKEKMDPQYLASDAIKGWLMVRFQDHYSGENLIEQLLYYGKIMYLLDAMMPHVPDSLKMNYTAEQINWCTDHEFQVWKELANQSTLFETKTFEINKWIQDGPFTSAGNVPQDSPSRLGIWMGWQIIRDYMSANPEQTLNGLLEEKDPNKILRYYQPK